MLTAKFADDRLLKQAALAKLNQPNKIDLKNLREWFERHDLGAYPIRGPDMTAWDEDEDLVAMKPRVSQDIISRCLTETVFPYFHNRFGERFKVHHKPASFGEQSFSHGYAR